MKRELNSVQTGARRLKRYQLIAFPQVWDRQTGEHVGHVVDITAEGMGMTCPVELKPQSVYGLTVELPSQILGVDRIDVDVECRWIRKNEDSGLSLAGVKFVNPPVDVVEVVEELIREYHR